MWSHKQRSLNLALQGGGAHGAFTWGVLDALLEHGGFDIAAVSGASAGSMNAIALAQGLMAGGPQGARDALARFWRAVGTHLPFEWLTVGHDDTLALAPAARLAMQWTQQLFAPPQFNPLDLNPLRSILQEQIDFDGLRRHGRSPLYIATTHANSGRLRLFEREELSVDVLLASACLPTLHHTVFIEGEPYWDGGYAANPALFPLLWNRGSAHDTLMVLLVPLAYTRTPRTAAEIRERAVDIAFNSTFLREVRTLCDAQAQVRGTWLPLGRMERRVALARWHLIDGQSTLSALHAETRMIAHLPFLERLRDAGRVQAQRWLEAHAAQVGRQSSVDLAGVFGMAG
jgi:NTE family protein